MRRKFLTTAAALATGAVAQAIPMQNTNSTKQVVHHVFFWLKNPGSVTDRDKLVEGLKTLSSIEMIRKLHVGLPAATEKRDVVDASWNVSELMFFDTPEDQKNYQSHPIHLAFIQNYGHLWAKVVVYDVEEV